MTFWKEFRETLNDFGLEYFKRYYSIYRGTVLSNEDPEFRGRVKVSCPAVYSNESHNYWALPMGVASGSPTMWAIPSVGDAIWVQFEGGDSRYPVWSWGWFMDDKAPKSAKVDGNKIAATVWQSQSGHRIVMDDKNKLVTISNASGIHIELTKDGVNIVGDSQKAVRGDELKAVMDKLFSILKTSKDITGKPFAPDTIAALELLEKQTFLSSKVKLK
jgi:hypothetical protein